MFDSVIGIEIHAELKSKNKVFSNTLNAFSQEPNIYVNEIDMALPGTLPQLNFEVVEMALKAALSLNCQINKKMQFDRKNYFYPDLPKGYQITQNKTPIGYDGFVEINVDGVIKKIRIARLHIEEDTCKSIHGSDTKLNFNRAGVPLIEIVTMPDITSSKEAILYLEKIKEILLYIGVSDVKMEEGSMRCEANVSLKEHGSEVLGTKVEVKNIGSITYAGMAIDHEIVRQTAILNNNQEVFHETRRFDEDSKTTILMRKKESGNDYRYFPEPDLPMITLEDEYIDSVKKSLPLLPEELREKYINYGLNDNYIKTIIGNFELNSLFLNLVDECDPIILANILTSFVLSEVNKSKKNISSIISKDDLCLIVNKRKKEEITSNNLKEIFVKYFDGESIEIILANINNDSMSEEELSKIILKICNDFPDSVLDHNNGSDRAIKFLMGQLMKETKGKIDPKFANEMLIKMLSDLH